MQKNESRLQERLRRARLYGVSSKYPAIKQKTSSDARSRRDLELLAQEEALEKDPLISQTAVNKLKHNVGRPLLNQIVLWHGLSSTVPQDPSFERDETAVAHKKDWRVGYRNTGPIFFCSIDGRLEPNESIRELLLLHQKEENQQICRAYPINIPTDVHEHLQPMEWKEPLTAQTLLGSPHSKIKSESLSKDQKRPSTAHCSGSTSAKQRFPLRTESAKPRSPLQLDSHCLEKKRIFLQKLELSNQKIRKK